MHLSIHLRSGIIICIEVSLGLCLTKKLFNGFLKQIDFKGQNIKWVEIFQEYDACLRYHKGQYNVVANALS